MPLAIRAIGPYRGPSGYDRMTREFARGLVDLGAHLHLVPLAGWSPDLPSISSDAGLDAHGEELDAEVAVHFTMPDRCRPVPGLRNANYTMFEATRIPAGWVERARDHERVILPNDACRDAWADSGVPASKLRVCGLGVDGAFFARPSSPLELAAPAGRPVRTFRRRLLHVGEPRPRKNHLGLLRAWMRATTRDDDAILVLKCAGSSFLSERFGDDVARMQQQLGRSLDEAAPVLFVTETLGDEELRALYHSATHYVTMSHGEAWDMPMMEAAAAGLSLIAPDQPNYHVYLGRNDADWIPCREVDARPEGQAGVEDFAYFHGLRWWQPDEAAAAELLARVVASDERRPPPIRRMLAEFTWARASARLLDLLSELL